MFIKPPEPNGTMFKLEKSGSNWIFRSAIDNGHVNLEQVTTEKSDPAIIALQCEQDSKRLNGVNDMASTGQLQTTENAPTEEPFQWTMTRFGNYYAFKNKESGKWLDGSSSTPASGTDIMAVTVSATTPTEYTKDLLWELSPCKDKVSIKSVLNGKYLNGKETVLWLDPTLDCDNAGFKWELVKLTASTIQTENHWQ
jgi:hypothetical protein